MPRTRRQRSSTFPTIQNDSPTPSETELTILIKKRNQVKTKILRFQEFLESSEHLDLVEIETRLQIIENVYSQFDEIQEKIEEKSNFQSDDNERKYFENLFFKTVTVAKKLIATYQSNKSDTVKSSVEITSNDNMQSNVKLPNLSLPEFYGNYSHWMSFYDIFNSLIHENTQLSKIQKFYYLKSCLKGEAAQLLQSLEVSNNNYDTAWKILKDRYENKKLIIHTHVKGLFDLVAVKTESYQHLRKLIDNFNKNYRVLESLEQPVDKWDTLLIYILTNKLDLSTKREWEEISSAQDTTSISDLTNFLLKKCQVLEALDIKAKKVTSPYSNGREEKNHLSHASTQHNISCSFCRQNHFNHLCEIFQKLSQSERFSKVKKLRLCTNCLRPNHHKYECKSSSCKYCQKRHHSLLHIHETQKDYLTTNKPVQNRETVDITPGDVNIVASHLYNTSKDSRHSQVLLATAMVKIKDTHGNLIECRAMLDSGSQSCFISESLVKKVKLKLFTSETYIAGINNSLTHISNRTNVHLFSTDNKFQCQQSFFVTNRITSNLPQFTFDSSSLHIPSTLKLADDCFNISKPIDMLLGASVFFSVLCPGQIKLGKNKPILQETKLGWIVSGTIFINSCDFQNVSCNLSITNDLLQTQLQRFWKIEECEPKYTYTQEERECEEHFVQNLQYAPDGRLIVSLPLHEHVGDLGDSQQTALRRFNYLEKRLQKDAKLKNYYNDFMQEYEALGHMTEIKPSNVNTIPHYYLPHHGVLKEKNTTTKLRVVFDASCKTTSGLSLNDVLKVGPTIQRDLFSIALKFRKHNIAFTADIEKMYRQVNVAEDNRDLQRIVWRSDPNDKIKHFQLNTVTYGTASAPFLAIRSLHQVAINNETKYPLACDIIKKDFYVDDLISGAESVEKCITLKKELTEVLDNAGFPLRKWCSNEKAVLENSSSSKLPEFYILSDDKSVKTLGLVWNPKSDNFQYEFKFDTHKSPITKRKVLSLISQLFDPLGLIGPTIVNAKIFMQKLWQTKLDWDETLPHNLCVEWIQFYNQLTYVNAIAIPRQVTIPKFVNIQIHGFCDASEAAYGACIYIQTTDNNGHFHSKLLCSKSRVAPLRKTTLPRLELCGALLLARLVIKVEKALEINIHEKFLCCDSMIVLAWISAHSNTWNTFVANRVSEIHDLTTGYIWRHVPTAQNPADFVSRGVNPQQLKDLTEWWSGPEFLKLDNLSWPNPIKINNCDQTLEKRTTINLTLLVYSDQTIFDKYSSLTKLQRVFAYVLRFLSNIKTKGNLQRLTNDNLTLEELNQSLLTLAKMSQSVEFKTEIHYLQSGKPLPSTNRLLSLNPFIDKNGILRVGGRIHKSHLSFDKKHPILLPAKHRLTTKLIEYEHKRHLHAGPQAVLTAIRKRFWIINGKNVIKKVIHYCVTCFRAKPLGTTVQMGNLPEARVMPVRPFLSVGVDFAGPLFIKDGTLRNRKIVKVYICLFVCFVTKAVHIELAGDLSTDAFLNALNRFVARRGLCKNVYSDNGTNFVGANNELKATVSSLLNKTNSEKIREFLSNREILWHFIPPRSPHFGGLWEAAIKSAKFHLVRIVGNCNLTFEKLYTVLCQIEAVLNSRPLTALSNSPQDLEALTPGHFLIGESLTAIPQDDYLNVPVSKLKLFHQLQQLVQHFWKRWSAEYLTSLQHRYKWKTSKVVPNQMKPGALVILKEDNVPCQQWKLGRIIEQHLGSDGLCRVVKVKTNNGVVKRSFNKICVLPVDATET